MAEPSVLERISEALAAEDGRDKPSFLYLNAARAAVEEMRRPTTKMLARGDEARAAGNTAGMIFMVMLDEASRELT